MTNASELLSTLTPLEREVLRHLAMGLSNAQIARKIFRSEKTVHGYVHRLYVKAGVKGTGSARVKLALLARSAGLVPIGTEP
jgi:DNA-binding NarL/FixJ family response regulator